MGELRYIRYVKCNVHTFILHTIIIIPWTYDAWHTSAEQTYQTCFKHHREMSYLKKHKKPSISETKDVFPWGPSCYTRTRFLTLSCYCFRVVRCEGYACLWGATTYTLYETKLYSWVISIAPSLQYTVNRTSLTIFIGPGYRYVLYNIADAANK